MQRNLTAQTLCLPSMKWRAYIWNHDGRNDDKNLWIPHLADTCQLKRWWWHRPFVPAHGCCYPAVFSSLSLPVNAIFIKVRTHIVHSPENTHLFEGNDTINVSSLSIQYTTVFCFFLFHFYYFLCFLKSQIYFKESRKIEPHCTIPRISWCHDVIDHFTLFFISNFMKN